MSRENARASVSLGRVRRVGLRACRRLARAALSVGLIAMVAVQGMPAFALQASLPSREPASTLVALQMSPGSQVIDFPGGYSSSLPARLKKAGVGIVIRYVGSAKWKSLTRKEADALRKAGIDIAAVYETSATWMLGGRAAGVSAAKKARAAVVACGGPRTPFVYFACDTGTNRYSTVNACLQGAASVLGADHVGVYGSYSVCASALKSGFATKAWQTEAWSGGKWLAAAALYQPARSFDGGLGIDYDSNHLRADDVGQWGYAPTGGSTWTTASVPTTATLRSVAFRDASSGVAVGDDGTVVRTADGGSTWTTVSTPATGTLRSVAFADSANGWAVGEDGSVVHTGDGGSTWTAASTPATRTLTSVTFRGANAGWAVGEAGTVVRTTDGGSTWTTASVAATRTLTSVTFRDANNGVAVGETGTVIRTSDGGATWAAASTPATGTLMSVAFRDAANGWAVGEAGSVIRTSDGGSTWAKASTPATTTLMSVGFTDANTGWAVGEGGAVIRTSDGGSTWTAVSVPTTATLLAASFRDANMGCVVGVDGTVLRALRAGGPAVWGHVAGVVVDAATGRPVSGATVQIGSRPAIPTATDGSFLSARVVPGVYRVTFTSPRYIASSTTGVVVTAGGTSRIKIRATPRTVTAVCVPSVRTSTPLRGVPLTIAATISPAAAGGLTLTTLNLSHYEKKTVVKTVKGKRRKVNVWYWRQRGRLTMSPGASGSLIVHTTLAAGLWHVYANCSGSGTYLPSTSATIGFAVR